MSENPSVQVRLDAVALTAADMATTLAFYRRLGCTFAENADTEEHSETDLGGVRLMFDAWSMLVSGGLVGPDDEPPSFDRPRDGASLAARCGSPAQVDELYASFAAGGYGVTEPWDAFWGQRYAVLRDPDGTQVDLYAPLPG